MIVRFDGLIIFVQWFYLKSGAGPHSAVGSPFDSIDRSPGFDTRSVLLSPDSRRAVVSYWQKYVPKVLVNHLGGLSVVRLTDISDMTIAVYVVVEQQQNNLISGTIIHGRELGSHLCLCWTLSD